MYTKIMVPLDGSMLAEKALPHAVRLANRFNAKLLLLRAVELPGLTVDTPESEIKVISSAEEYMTEVQATLTNPKIAAHIAPERVQTLVVYGDAVEQVVELAPFEKVDLIVMTTHGRSGLSRLVTGSVAGRILHRTHVPIMLVRPQELKNDQLLVETMMGIAEPCSDCFDSEKCRIVLTLDGSPLAETALEPAMELAQKLNATLHLLSVILPAPPMVYGDLVGMGYSQDEVEVTRKRLTEDAQVYLNEAQHKALRRGLEVVTAVRVGATAEEIADYAKRVEATALVMATHARGEVSHLFVGSVAEDVMRISRLPVLMISTHAQVKQAEQVVNEEKVETDAVSW